MAKTAVNLWDSTAANNTEINSIGIQGTNAVQNFDNAFRELMAQVATQFGIVNIKGADIASATTTDLSAATGNAIDITGTTTITGLGTVAAGQMFILQFDGALTFTHNATSLKLPGAANITTAAGDIAVVVSEGSGNWRCLHYQRYAQPESQRSTTVTLSGTSQDFTIPSWVNCIDVSYSGISHDSGSAQFFYLRLGDAGGVETTGYAGSIEIAGTPSLMSVAIFLSGGLSAGTAATGIAHLRRNSADGTSWVVEGTTGFTTSAGLNYYAGSKTLSADLTTVQILPTGGSFDAGTATVTYW